MAQNVTGLKEQFQSMPPPIPGLNHFTHFLNVMKKGKKCLFGRFLVFPYDTHIFVEFHCQMTEKRTLLYSGNQGDIASICLNVQMRARVPLCGDRAEEVDGGL